jgi:hypothetical protein
MRKAYIPFVLIIIRISGHVPKLGFGIARRLTRSVGWGSPADEGRGVKPPLTPETLPFKVGHS